MDNRSINSWGNNSMDHKNMNKHGKISSIIIGVVLLGMIVIGFSSFSNNLASTYGRNMSTSQYESMNKIDNISNNVNNMRDKLDKGSDSDMSADADIGLLTGGWSAIKLILNLPDILISLVSDIANILGVPHIFVTGITVIIISVIIFGLISLIFKRDA